MPAPKPLIPADLASLEHAFAADPSSDAWRPLTVAYLSMSRFMEAMVVAKKGVKARPHDPDARLLLARVYSDQGKDRRALEEVQTALGASPAHVPALLVAGELHGKLGQKDAAAAVLRKAAQVQPDDEAVLAALQRWGVEPPPPAPVKPAARATPVPAPAGPPVVARTPATAPAATARAAATPAARLPAVAAPASTSPLSAADAGTAVAAPPAAAPRKRKRTAIVRDVDRARALSEKYETQEWALPDSGEADEAREPDARKQSHGLRNSLLLLGAFSVVLAAWWGFSAWRRSRDEEVSRLLKESAELIAKDGHSQYVRATALLEQLLKRDSGSRGGNAYLAYVDALRFGEHGEGDAYREGAQKHLAALKGSAARHSHALAADAYLKAFAGDPRGAIADLNKVLKGPEGGTSGLLYGVLGILQMQTGDLDAARESLVTARKFADRDVRLNQMLAEVYRRGGQTRKAKTFYDAAYALSKDHVPTLLGAASVYADEGQWDTALKFVQAVLDGGDASPRQKAMARAIKGAILFGKGRAAEGAAEEQQALTLDPSNPDLLDQIGRRKLSSGDASGAADAFRKAADMDPQRVGFQADLAAALLAQPGGARAARESLQAAQARLPGNPRIAKLLGDAYRGEGDRDKARAEYEKAAAARAPDARLALARMARDEKRFPEAIAEYEKAAREFGDTGGEGAAQAWSEAAEVEAQRGGDAARISEFYRKALAVDPTSCPALWALGRERLARSEKDQRDLGRQMLQDYVRVCPKGSHAAEASRLSGAK